MKKVIVFSTRGTGKAIETNALNWGELQAELSKAGVEYQGLKAVDGATKHTFEAKDALLPEGDMNLFLFPVKTKSGAGVNPSSMTFGDLRAFIKEAFEKDKDNANAHFNEGKNYTNKSTDTLRELVASYVPSKSNGKSSAKTPSAPVAKAVSKVVESVKEAKTAPAKTTGVRSVASSAAKDTVKQASNLPAKKQETGLATSLDSTVDVLIEALESLEGVNKADREAAIKAVLRLKVAKAGDIDNDALAAQARDLARSFPDVRM